MVIVKIHLLASLQLALDGVAHRAGARVQQLLDVRGTFTPKCGRRAFRGPRGIALRQPFSSGRGFCGGTPTAGIAASSKNNR
jgi:hypothetical protein